MADNLDNRVDRLESRMDRAEYLFGQAAIITLEVSQAQKENEKLLHELAASQKHTDDRLNVLIRVMDEWIRANPRPSPSPA